MNKEELKIGNSQIIIYQTSDGSTQLDVQLENDTVWLTQTQMVELFDSSKANISEHIKNIYSSEELEENSTVRKNRTVRKEGKSVRRNKQEDIASFLKTLFSRSLKDVEIETVRKKLTFNEGKFKIKLEKSLF